MKKYFFVLLFFIFAFPALSQDTFTYDDFTITLENSVLRVNDGAGKELQSIKFHNALGSENDLDDDGISELMVLDSSEIDNKPIYKLYVFNTVDSFYLADSIESGSYEPYERESEETRSTIIIAGNVLCESYNTSKDNLFLPLNCWKYEDGQLFLINDEVYEIFITENEALVDFLDDEYNSSKKDCTSSEKLKSAIASVYLNYLNAGEISIASKFIKNYYFCGDIEQFTKELNSHTETEEN